MSDGASLPAGFEVGHYTDAKARTGCTVVLAPPGSRGGVEVPGGGPGTRETDAVRPTANVGEVSAVLLTGGSAHGLAAADGVVAWLEERGRGYSTPAGLVPIVPAAVVYDLADGDPAVRPTAESGRAACDSASPGVPERGRVGAGSGAAVGKLRGREHAPHGGVGYAASTLGGGETVAAIAVANAVGDVIGADGSVLAGPGGGEPGDRSRDLIAAMGRDVPWERDRAEGDVTNTTLACVCTDAALSKLECTLVARMACAGIARAVDPVYSPLDGDIVFCLSSGDPPGPTRAWEVLRVGSAAATVVADAIRDAVMSGG